MTTTDHPDAYLIDDKDIPEDALKKLSPWVSGFVQSNDEERLALLAWHWRDIKSPILRQLADFLMDSKFIEVVVTDWSDGYLAIQLREKGRIMYLHGPDQSQERYLESFQRLGMAHPEFCAEVAFYFGGLAQGFMFSECAESDFPMGYLSLGRIPPRQCFVLSSPEAVPPENGTDWSGSVCFFSASDGSSLLIGVDGSVGWDVCDQGVMWKRADSLEDYMVEFLRFFKVAEVNEWLNPYSDEKFSDCWKMNLELDFDRVECDWRDAY